jgi:hypothetical protein
MLMCDGCGAGWHSMCLPVPMAVMPPEEEVWICPRCEQQGMTLSAAAQQRASSGAEPRLPETQVFANAKRRRFLDQCKALDGRVVCKAFIDPSTRRVTRFWGTARFRGDHSAPHYFEVAYTDGDSETMSLAALQRILRPAGTTLPAEAQTPTGARTRSRAQAVVATAAMAPTDPTVSLQDTMPGSWEASRLTSTLEAAQTYASSPELAVPVPDAATAALLGAVRIEACLTAWDPFATVTGLAAALTGHPVECPPALAADVMVDPAAWRQRPAAAALEAVVMAPWAPVLDLALALALPHATRVVCCYVPLGYVRDAHPARRRFIGALRDAGRLVFVQPRDPGSSTGGAPLGVWLVIFASPTAARALLVGTGSWGTAL